MSYALQSALWLVPSLIVLVGCIVYVGRRPSPAGILALIGNVGGIGMRVVSIMLFILLHRPLHGGVSGLAMRAGTFLFAILFAIGFLLLALESRLPGETEVPAVSSRQP